MDKNTLRQFIVDSNKAGYATGDQKKWIKEIDGSTTISFEKGIWKSNDNFFGGEPYGGRTILYHEGNPVWIMVYYGWVEKKVEPDSVYKTLRNALIQMPIDHPFRGPKEYNDGEYIYTNSWEGEIDRFSGKEQIIFKENVVYQATYMGGLVNQQNGV